MTAYPLNQWNPSIQKGVDFVVRFSFAALDGYDDAVWTLRLAEAGEAVAFYESDPGDWDAVTGTDRTLTIPAATVADFPKGNIAYQLDVSAAGSLPSFRVGFSFPTGQVVGGLTAPV